MNQQTAAAVTLTAIALAGITATTVQTIRLDKTKSKLRSAAAGEKVFTKAYMSTLKRLNLHQLERHVDDMLTDMKFDIITHKF